jgi:hypothetical protein
MNETIAEACERL